MERGSGENVVLPHLKTGVSTNLVRDFRDQLRKAELDNAGNVSWYATDAAGERVWKVWDKGSVVEERIYLGGYEVWRKRNGSGVLQEERQTLHVMDDQRRVAMIETLTVTGGSAVSTPTPRFRYQLDDQLGSALLEVDDDGGVISYEEYHPYGTTAWWAQDAAIEVSRKRYRYTGKERDEETGLQYHSARYYAPWLGRWDRPDPIELGDGGHRWRYVHGEPIGLRDPSGFEDIDETQGKEVPFRVPLAVFLLTELYGCANPSPDGQDDAIPQIGEAETSTTGTAPIPSTRVEPKDPWLAEMGGFDPKTMYQLAQPITYTQKPTTGPATVVSITELSGADLNMLAALVYAESSGSGSVPNENERARERYAIAGTAINRTGSLGGNGWRPDLVTVIIGGTYEASRYKKETPKFNAALNSGAWNDYMRRVGNPEAEATDLKESFNAVNRLIASASGGGNEAPLPYDWFRPITSGSVRSDEIVIGGTRFKDDPNVHRDANLWRIQESKK